VARIGLAIASIALFTATAEIFVRASGADVSVPTRTSQFRFDQELSAARPHHVRDPVLGWRLRPNQSDRIRTNRAGFRGPELTREKPPNTLRYVFLGDSNPLGFGLIDENEPYPARVQEILRRFAPPEDGRAIECVNLAVDGYSSEQVRRLAEEMIPALDPDVVIVQVGFNDYCVAARPDAEALGVPTLAPLERSQAYRWLRRQILQTRSDRSRWTSDPVPRVSVPDHANNLRAIARLARGAGAALIVVMTPVRPAVPLVVNEVKIDGTWVAQEAWLRARLTSAGVTNVDSVGSPEYLDVVMAAEKERPDWPLLPFMIARSLEKLGRTAEAAAYDARWRSIDRERAELERYMDAARSVARDEGARLIETREVLQAYLDGEGRGSATDLYLDFVHLDGRGHVVLATEIARVLVELRTSPPRASSPSE